ncbi:glutathione peroxidase [Ixodes scapularis]
MANRGLILVAGDAEIYKANLFKQINICSHRSMKWDHVTLIVNVASKCTLTQEHYTKLSALYHKYSESKGLRIMAFPTNDFAKQEPWAEPEIKEFVKKQFNVTFDMFSKISVNGDNAHPLWKYLKERQPGFLFNAIKWNFTKFLVDKNGQPVKRYGPTDSFETIEADLLKYFEKTE